MICVRAWRSLFEKTIFTKNQREGHVVSGVANEFWAMVWLVSLALIPILFLLLMFKPRPFQPSKDREPAAMREALSPGEVGSPDTVNQPRAPLWAVRTKYLFACMYLIYLILNFSFPQIATALNLCSVVGK